MPETLTLTIDEADIPECACLEGTTITLTYSPGSDSWVGLGSLCGIETNVEFSCNDPPSWFLEFDSALGNSSVGAISATSCDPFIWQVSNFAVEDAVDCEPGAGFVNINVTITA
jgi:hypothetical protein